MPKKLIPCLFHILSIPLSTCGSLFLLFLLFSYIEKTSKYHWPNLIFKNNVMHVRTISYRDATLQGKKSTHS